MFAVQDTMSENSQDTLINNSQEDILSSKLENTKIDGEDPENPLESVNKVSQRVMLGCNEIIRFRNIKAVP